MISLRLFPLILTTLVCREIAGNTPNTMLMAAMLATAGITLGMGLLFKASALTLLMTTPADEPNFGVRDERLQRIRSGLEAAWVMLLPAALLLTGWGAWLNSLEQSHLPQFIAMLGWFLPSLCLILLIELTAAQFDELTTPPSLQSPNDWQTHFRIRLRLGEIPGLVTCLAPVLAIALFSDIGHWTLGEEHSGIVLALLTVLSLGLVLSSVPLWLGKWLGTSPATCPELLERFMQYRSGLRMPQLQLLTIGGDGRWNGAAIVGWLPRWRQLWLGEDLIADLDDEQLDMVMMHEFAHVTRRHFWWRSLPIVGAGLAMVLTFALGHAWFSTVAVDAGPASSSIQAGALPGGILAPLPLIKLLGCTTAVLALLLGLSTAARVCELDADRQACHLAVLHCSWAQGEPARAAARLSQALVAILADSAATQRATWLHPSLTKRLENLARLSA